LINKYKNKTTPNKDYSGYDFYFFKNNEFQFVKKVNDITLEYVNKYPQLKIQCGNFQLTEMRFKHFKSGNFFKIFHAEHCFEYPYRILNFMIYLSNHEEGTEFYSGETIKSKKGRAVIFPAFWTHLHKGQKCIKDRFMVGGYYNFIGDGA
jgi:hypothetical protein